jgi:glycosyltransferase involved in cell wall biosynthesis
MTIIEGFAQQNPNVKGVRFMKILENRRPCMLVLLKQGDVIITMDADLQDSPEEIPGLYDMINGTIWFRVGKKTLRFCCC